MQLSLGFSPCPNDTFIFYAIAHQKIDLEGLHFDIRLGDVEELNEKAFQNELDITKLSFHAFAKLIKDYVLLDSGSALGNNCGPLLIAKKQLNEAEVNNARIAIPGENTTANFLLSLAYPKARRKVPMLFSEIENSVLESKANAGLIIHENRFTYQDKGLVKIIDLGEYWEKNTGMPIPLGGICIKRSFPVEIRQKVNRIMKRSVRYAFEHREETRDYVRHYAQEMSEEVMYKHIGLYVNDFTLDLGTKGKQAIQLLFDKAEEKGIIPKTEESIFLQA